ncbi:thiamine biosynthesis lipoprotein [Hydrocarboniphaga daqingensis]|uniref:FAD:protein FMN transferase n=1 Tax=Hydrocarboniphaga daqingensis TaxID=490188 RepID=A0A1M5JM66_9GAMM|nr:FAD:protein FMN transferase [Hydrocarboniphaga daqingensis]SHG41666.1 thiamine biosynthesis lipoprotein [Hydrocarboniphaga daqingensis]
MRSLFTPRTLLRHSFMAMGTDVQMTLAPRRRHQIRQARAALAEVQQLVLEFGHDGWAWGSGELGQFNRRLATGSAAPVPSALRPIFDRAWQLHRATRGLYEPRIASLVHLWGFDDQARRRSQPPGADEIALRLQALQSAPDYRADAAEYGPAPGVGWDLGGIAKGYIVDQALALLAQRGFGDATVDAGGNVAARGRRHDRAWLIGIRAPLDGTEGDDEPTRLIAALSVRDEAVNTHGDDQRYFVHQGQRYAHLLNPETGEPAQGLRSLTVVHNDGMLAEAGGAALYVAGARDWPVLAASLGIDQVLAVESSGRIVATPKLLERLRLQPGVTIDALDITSLTSGIGSRVAMPQRAEAVQTHQS